MLTADVSEIVIFILALIIGIAGHEFAHASLADRLGDPTPRQQGRVTINPLAHLDPLGTLFLFLFRFGWGKPVPVDSRYFAHPVTDEIQVALAGPFANLTMAVGIGLLYRLFPAIGLAEYLDAFIQIFVQLNLVLMVFNLIPLPPLDGSRILRLFLPESAYLFLEQFGILFLFILVLSGSAFIQELFTWTVVPLSQILLGT